MAVKAVHREPYADADVSLRALAGAAEGFGCETIGGRDGPVYVVTSLADGGPGSLRDACDVKGPLWITFGVSGTIQLDSAVRVRSHKTIDGRGQRVVVTGNGLHLKQCEHVIVCNLCFSGGRGHDVDAIKVKPDTRHVWIDRCTLECYDDGLIDITRGSSHITVSRCHFLRHDKTMLVGADASHTDDRGNLRVTVHRCFFDGTRQRHPRVRYGMAHLYNNYTRGWGVYAVCASIESQVLSQNCVYEATQKRKTFEFYYEKAPDGQQEETGCLRSEVDVFLDGAEKREMRPQAVFNPSNVYLRDWSLTDCSRELVMATAGWQSVPLPRDISVDEGRK